jgi:putative colanic acid biosynthesis acetyltransferase WcaF
MHSIQNLAQFSISDDYCANQPIWRWCLWFGIGSPLVSSGLPGSKWRRLLLNLFGASVGRGVVLKPHLRVKFPWRLEIGASSWIGEFVWIDNLEWVRIGHDACISQGVYFCTGNHNYRDPAFSYRLAPITVEAEAWIAAMSRIAPGVVIGYGAVLGLASVALDDLKPLARYQGAPAQLIGPRLTSES